MGGSFSSPLSVNPAFLRMGCQFIKQLRHTAGKVAAGELRDVRISDRQLAFEMLFPASVYEAGERSLVLPIQNDSGLGVIQDHGHRSVRLADSKHRPE